MNDQPIEQAQDDDLRQSRAAMMRAAERAREVAERTGTELVVAQGREVAYLKPESARSRHASRAGAGGAIVDAAGGLVEGSDREVGHTSGSPSVSEAADVDARGAGGTDEGALQDEASRG